MTSSAADALAGLDQAAPVTEILTGLAQAYATGDRMPAVRAQQQAEAEGAITLAAEALTVRGRIGDAPGQNLAAAHAAWVRIGAPGRAAAVAASMRAAGLPEPVAERPRPGPAPPPTSPSPFMAVGRGKGRWKWGGGRGAGGRGRAILGSCPSGNAAWPGWCTKAARTSRSPGTSTSA